MRQKGSFLCLKKGEKILQMKNDSLLEKFVKKDYNNELEKVLEKKKYEENVKSILLNILYKLEMSYKDYKKVKQDVPSKDELIENIIKIIENDCDEIRLVKPQSKESEIIGDRTFLVEKKKKRIICYNVERKVLYCLAKISKKNKIINDKYIVINKTLSDLINVGACINEVEPLRDFNGYSWTTIPKEIESITHNLLYQNLLLLVGTDFMNKWINNKEFIMDYMKLFKEKLEEYYGKENANKLLEVLKEVSIYLEIKFDKKAKEKFLRNKEIVEQKLLQMADNEKFIEKITVEKRNIAKKIKEIDETINNKHLLEEEYEKRNEVLPLEEKIFSLKILSKIMVDERSKELEKLEKLNELLNPQNYISHKKELEEQEKYFKLIDNKDIESKIEKLKLNFQKLFIKCFEQKIEKCDTKSNMLKLIYEFRYYMMIPYSLEKDICEEDKLKKEIEKVTKKILEKSHELKVIQRFSKQEDIDYELLKIIFQNRNINIEDIEIKLIREKAKIDGSKNGEKCENYYIQVYDGNGVGEKKEMPNSENMNKKDLAIMFNKKVRVFY